MTPWKKKTSGSSLAVLGLLALTAPVSASTDFTTPTAGQCQRMTNLTINSGIPYDITASVPASSNSAVNVQPYVPTIPAYGSTGFLQVYQGSDTGWVTYQIQDGITNPSFKVSYTGDLTGASALAGIDNTYFGDAEAGFTETLTHFMTKDIGGEAALGPAGEVLMAWDVLDFFWHFLAGLLSDMQYYGQFALLSQTPSSSLPADADLSPILSSSSSSQLIVVAQNSSNAQAANIMNGYVVGASAINSGCPNYVTMQVTPYCAYVCGNELTANPSCQDCSDLFPALDSVSQNDPITASATGNSEKSTDVPPDTTLLPGYANDGDSSTRWGSWGGSTGSSAANQWLQIDLGASYALEQISIDWESAYATAYTIQLSADGQTWTQIYATTKGAGGTETLPIGGTGRYVKLNMTQAATQYGYSIWEFVVNAQPMQPTGSYTQSCSGIQWNSPVLTASCTTTSGASMNSSVNTSACPGYTISNINGQLTCDS